MANVFNATTTTGLQLTPDNSGAIQLQTNNGTTAMTISTAQAVTTTNAINMGSSFLRNRIINGAMQIAQRGTSFTSVNGYTLDRWAVFSVGTFVNAAQIGGPAGFSFALQITGVTGNTQAQCLQRIESYNIADLAGTTVTLSVTMQASSLQTVGWTAYYPTSADNYTGSTLITSGTFSVTTTATRFTTQISLPSNVANGLQISFSPNNFGAFTSGTLTITGVQLEAGSVATPFEFKSIGDTLVLCQRYYYKLKAATAFANAGVGRAYSTTNAQAMIGLPVSMRTGPTGSYSALSDWNDSGGGTPSAIDPVNQYSSDCRWMTVNLTGTYTSGQSIVLNANNTTNAYIAWSAEL